VIERLSRLLGTDVRTLTRVQSSGYTVAYHAIAELADETTVFVKAATEPVTAGFILDEQRVLAALNGAFLPEVRAMDDEDPPLLVLEDLRGAHWPPPWDEAKIDAVRETLAAVAATEPPGVVPPIGVHHDHLVTGWAEIEADSAPFLSLGVCSAEWLDYALPKLREASETAPIDGNALLHLDVRSDNLCIARRGAVLVDWNHACVGNADLDVAAWLPSLRLEGGPEPEEILPGAPGFAALLAGFFGSRAGLPAPPTAPHVRAFQLAQLRVALPWATRELDLRPPG
jgi:aminoglycoside phosphotransferase (APT) family kinase protein